MIDAPTRSALERALADDIAFDVPMARHTSLRVGGPADALATPSDRTRLAAVLRLCREHGLRHLLLGAGFNTLVGDDGVDGVVIKLSRFRTLEQRGEDAVYAEAGVTHASLTRFCVDRGLSGLEFGAGIPGVVGGWVRMNAGIGVREVEAAVRELELMSPETGLCELVSRSELRFVYRSLESLESGAVVVSALFEIERDEPNAVKAEVDRLLSLRAGTQPLNVPSCGSVWKNPEGDFAGRLIEAAGLKGAREGGAQISPVHANFIANTGSATACDVKRLMDRTRERVAEASGVVLEPEVKIIERHTRAARRSRE